ncbi:MAG: hypothetical protein ACKO37_08000 [Vampirovibrionales bacterium]
MLRPSSLSTTLRLPAFRQKEGLRFGVEPSEVLSLPQTPVTPQGVSVTSNQLNASQRQFAETVLDKDYLPNPYEATKKRISLFPSDHPLDWTVLDKGLYQTKQLGFNTPRNLIQGLKGSPDFDFTKQMSLNIVPFTVGSALFVSSYLAGGTSVLARNRALAGTALYALGQLAGKGIINTAYKTRWGFDLSDKYLKANRQDTGPIAVSVDFPRTDLIPPETYQKYRKRWSIPDTIAYPQDAAEDRLRIFATQERFLMSACTSLLSAIGAGYFAQSDHWRVLWGQHPPYALNVFKAPSRALLLGAVRAVYDEKLYKPIKLGAELLYSPKAYPLWRELSHSVKGQFKAFLTAVGVGSLVGGYTLGRILLPPPRPHFETATPVLPTLNPQATPEPHPTGKTLPSQKGVLV